jgi:hypothetical protein
MTHAERIRQRDEDDMRTLLNESWGRRIVWRLMKQCCMNSVPIVYGMPDATAFNLGKQDIGKALLAEVLNINPEAYMKMVKAGKKDDELMQKEMEDERTKQNEIE